MEKLKFAQNCQKGIGFFHVSLCKCNFEEKAKVVFLNKFLFPYIELFLESSNAEYGSSAYASGQMRIAFIRSNEILISQEIIAIGGNRLSGGVVLTTTERYRDLWLKV